MGVHKQKRKVGVKLSRRARVAAAILKGEEIDSIAAREQIGVRTAWRDWAETKEEWRKQREDALGLLEREYGLLLLQDALSAQEYAKNPSPRWMSAWLKVGESRRRLLGLDKATGISIESPKQILVKFVGDDDSDDTGS